MTSSTLFHTSTRSSSSSSSSSSSRKSSCSTSCSPFSFASHRLGYQKNVENFKNTFQLRKLQWINESQASSNFSNISHQALLHTHIPNSHLAVGLTSHQTWWSPCPWPRALRVCHYPWGTDASSWTVDSPGGSAAPFAPLTPWPGWWPPANPNNITLISITQWMLNFNTTSSILY